MLASRTGAVVLILGNVLIVLRLIGREETALEQHQGEAYRAFRASVPRLWPSLRPRLPASGMPPRWSQAFLGEAHLWVFAMNGFIFAWRLNTRLYYIIFGVSFAASFLLRIVVQRVRQRNSPPLATDRPASLIAITVRRGDLPMILYHREGESLPPTSGL